MRVAAAHSVAGPARRAVRSSALAMELLVLLGVLCVVVVNAMALRLRVSAPLLLVVIGVVVSVQRSVTVPVVEVDAEIVLAGVLPLLLFAAARSMPATNFRRNLSSITGLSITLVVSSALTLGARFSAMLPGSASSAGSRWARSSARRMRSRVTAAANEVRSAP